MVRSPVNILAIKYTSHWSSQVQRTAHLLSLTSSPVRQRIERAWKSAISFSPSTHIRFNTSTLIFYLKRTKTIASRSRFDETQSQTFSSTIRIDRTRRHMRIMMRQQILSVDLETITCEFSVRLSFNLINLSKIFQAIDWFTIEVQGWLAIL